MIRGNVGKTELNWKTRPQGKSGEAQLEMPDGKLLPVRWVRDDQGIWVETNQGFFGYDVRKYESEDALPEYEILKRRSAKEVRGLSYLKAGEEKILAGSAAKKKKPKLKSQMPGKILKIMVEAGQAVEAGASIMVMEAMKMENEIKSPQAGVVKTISVSEGQAVETGAELVVFEWE